MTLEQEKKLVAEFMGWEVGKKPPFPDTVLIYRIGCFPDTNVNVLEPEHWNPQTDRNAWPEIWDKMGRDFKIEYLDYLRLFLLVDKTHLTLFDYLTASPEVCWQALIKVLEAK